MTRRMSYRHVRTSKATPERLHALLTDAPGWPAWAPLVKEARWETAHSSESPGPGVGWVRAVGAGKFITRERITAHEPGHQHGYTVLGDGPLGDYQSLVTLTPEGSGTRLVWEGEWTPSGVIGVPFGLFTKAFVGKLADGLIAYAER